MTAGHMSASRPRLGRILDRGAVRDIAPVGVAVAPLGVVVGVTVVVLGVPELIGAASSPLVYSASAQLTYLTLAAADSGIIAILTALLLVNARLVIYSSGLAPYFRDQPAWFRWLTPTFIVDQTFVVVVGRRDLLDPARFRRYWLTAGCLLGAMWTAATVSGLLLGPRIPEVLALDVAAPALYIGLLVPRIVDRDALAVAGVAAVAAAASFGSLGPLALPVAMLCGIVVVAATSGRRRAARPATEVAS